MNPHLQFDTSSGIFGREIFEFATVAILGHQAAFRGKSVRVGSRAMIVSTACW